MYYYACRRQSLLAEFLFRLVIGQCARVCGCSAFMVLERASERTSERTQFRLALYAQSVCAARAPLISCTAHAAHIGHHHIVMAADAR